MNLRVEDAGKNGGSLVTVSLPEDPLGVLPEVPEEHFPESFRKKCSSGSNQTSSERTLLPEESRKTSSGNFPEEVVHPEEFRKTRTSGRTFKVPEDLSGRTLLPECFRKNHFFRKWFFCFFFVFFFKFFLNRNCFVFFK